MKELVKWLLFTAIRIVFEALLNNVFKSALWPRIVGRKPKVEALENMKVNNKPT
jgi:hypothetical protein